MHFRHAKEKRDKRRLEYKGWKVVVSVAIFWIFVSIIPIYNKVVFSGVAGDQGFPYPLTTTFFQLSLCAVILTLYSIFRRFTFSDYSARSWIFGKEFFFKARHTFLIGIFFGMKFGITNWGLKLIPVASHVLLQSTDIMWTILFAHILNRETLDRYEFMCCLGTIIGSLLIAHRTHETIPGLFPILVNLLSPILLGLCVSELRRSTETLLIKHNSPNGRVPFMDSFELTAFKLWFSSLAVLPFAILIEGKETVETKVNLDGTVQIETRPSVLIALQNQSIALTVAAIGGGLLILIYQVNITWLTKLTSAISVGIVAGVKIIPQWLVALLVSGKIDTSVYHLAGAGLLLLSSILWTKLKYGSIEQNVEEMQRATEQLQLRYDALLINEAPDEENLDNEENKNSATSSPLLSSQQRVNYGTVEDNKTQP